MTGGEHLPAFAWPAPSRPPQSRLVEHKHRPRTLDHPPERRVPHPLASRNHAGECTRSRTCTRPALGGPAACAVHRAGASALLGQGTGSIVVPFPRLLRPISAVPHRRVSRLDRLRAWPVPALPRLGLREASSSPSLLRPPAQPAGCFVQPESMPSLRPGARLGRHGAQASCHVGPTFSVGCIAAAATSAPSWPRPPARRFLSRR